MGLCFFSQKDSLSQCWLVSASFAAALPWPTPFSLFLMFGHYNESNDTAVNSPDHKGRDVSFFLVLCFVVSVYCERELCVASPSAKSLALALCTNCHQILIVSFCEINML